ncbi:MAG: hypothetical protein J7M29_01285 [Verrucomicrobia bacterium]|nr:hypothetical protein [Verrucomicrobiota bacterium]
MGGYLDCLIGRAFRHFPGTAWNAARRQIIESSDIAPVFYETAAKPGEDWETFRDRVYPLFVKVMKAQGVDPENPTPSIVALFEGDRCHLLEGREFLRCLQEAEGLNAASLHFRILRWLAE